MKKDSFIKDAIILCIITLISGLCLGLVYDITKAPIAKAQEATKQAAYKKVFQDAASFKENEANTLAVKENKAVIDGLNLGNVEIDEVVDALDSNNTVIGHVVTSISNDGYGGAVKLSVGITSEGQVNGIAFLSISETAGLGMNATKPKFYEQYAGKTVESFNVVKVPSSNDSDINAISGATITSRAVTSAVNAALYFDKNCISQ